MSFLIINYWKKNILFNVLGIVLLYFFHTAFPIVLDQLAIKHGTDKSSLGHNYTEVYEKYFLPLQNKPLKFLEIGFACGSSARMWDAFFVNPESNLVFIDFKPECYNYMLNLSARCSLHSVNQRSETELEAFIQKVGGDFDIIIDDGGHTYPEQLTSFRILFPYVKKGGVYIIEDLHTSYWRDYGAEGDCQNPKASGNSTIRFLQNLVDDLNFIGARTACAHRTKGQSIINNLTLYQESISSIHFYTSLCFIFKN